MNVCDEVWFYGQEPCFKAGLQLIMDNDTGIALVDGFEANTHEACTEGLKSPEKQKRMSVSSCHDEVKCFTLTDAPVGETH